MFIFFKVRFNNVGIVDHGIVELKGIGIRMMVVLSRHVLKGCILEEKKEEKQVVAVWIESNLATFFFFFFYVPFKFFLFG